MNYKRILKNQKIRFKILELFNFIPDKAMIKLQYKIKMGRKLNLKNPMRYTEKLQWYKLNYRDPLMTQCADKYGVRDYVKSKGLEDILNELYGVYDNVDQIDFDTLPNKFVVKTTNGSGTNIICRDKQKLNIKETRKQLNEWLLQNKISAGREWAYDNIKEKIIIEKYLEDEVNIFKDINDYKFICFEGNVKCIVLDVNRSINHQRNFYDPDWNFIDVDSDHPNIGEYIPKPQGLNEMLQVAEILSKDFPFVRVDLYWINNKVIFGELTFYPWSGYVQYTPDEFDYILGKQFILPKKMNIK